MAINRRNFLQQYRRSGRPRRLLPAALVYEKDARFLELTVSAQEALPPAEASGIQHIVVVMMENRSFDHFLGWLPGANGHPRERRRGGRSVIVSLSILSSASRGTPIVRQRVLPHDQLAGRRVPLVG